MSKKTYSELLLSTMRALLGVIPQELRGVAVELKNNDIILYFYHNGEISPEIDDEYRCVAAEVIADFTDGIIEDMIIRIDYPKQLPEHSHWVYRRKEDFSG